MTFSCFSRFVRLGVIALAAFAALACGPSVQLIYEGNMRFEHCYRLDFDEHIAPSHRRACWSEWVESYAQGQTRDRIEYGKRRIDALDHGDGAALSMHLEDDSDAGPPPVRANPAPAPTSAHAPPPAVSPPPVPSSLANPEPMDAGVATPPADGTDPDAGAGQGRAKGNRGSEPNRGREKKTKS